MSLRLHGVESDLETPLNECEHLPSLEVGARVHFGIVMNVLHGKYRMMGDSECNTFMLLCETIKAFSINNVHTIYYVLSKGIK